MNELFKIDMDKREIVLNYKHYNVNIDILNFIVDLLKKQEDIKFYIEQSNIKDMLWGKEILKIIGGNDEQI